MSSLLRSAIPRIGAVLAMAGMVRAAAPTAIEGKWRSAEGDVVEIRAEASGVAGVLLVASPSGLGAKLAAGSVLFKAAAVEAGAIRCDVPFYRLRRLAANLHQGMGGKGSGTIDEAGTSIVLSLPVKRYRDIVDENQSFLDRKVVGEESPLVVRLVRAGDGAPRFFLVRPDGVLEPVQALSHDLPYAVEVRPDGTMDAATIRIEVAADGAPLVLDASAVGEGPDRRYRTRPFVIRADVDEAAPATPTEVRP